MHAIVGENGAGKSSLGKAIAGVYRMRGQIVLDEREVSFRSPREALRHGVALIHQEPQVFLDLEVAENVFAGILPRTKSKTVDWTDCYRRTGALLDQLGARIDQRASVRGLSVAQRQMVELASALAHEARVWIFDETTAPLTPRETEDLFAVMRRLRDQGCAIAFISHHLHEVFAVSDRITVLRDGKRVFSAATTETNPDEIVRNMVGRDIPARESRPRKSLGPLLSVNGLSGYGFTDVNLQVGKGEIVGIGGLVGAGRTELLRALFGVDRPRAGRVLLEGNEVNIDSPRRARQLGVALVPEDRIHDGLLTEQSIAFNSVLANLYNTSRFGWVDRHRESRQTLEQASALSLRFRSEAQLVKELSGGNQQKVVLAKWLLTNPRLLLLDEPTRGVDVGAKSEVHRIVRGLADEGIAVLVVSSDLPELLGLCDRILVMREGRIAGEVDAQTATEEQVMTLATGGPRG